MKQVRETSAGKSISAYIILNKKGEEVATVQAHYSNGGRVMVDVWQTSLALNNCCKRPDLWSQLPAGKDYRSAAYDLWGLQQSKADGTGYDKLAAALAGLIIDGHTLADHSGLVPEDEKKRSALLKKYQRDPRAYSDEYWREKAHAIGCRWANWTTDGWRSLHFIAGLGRLERLGYRVIQAI